MCSSGHIFFFGVLESKLKLFAVSLKEDGVALKPGLNVDSHQAKIIGATAQLVYSSPGTTPRLQPKS